VTSELAAAEIVSAALAGVVPSSAGATRQRYPKKDKHLFIILTRMVRPLNSIACLQPNA
jgi:hypothetical protein